MSLRRFWPPLREGQKRLREATLPSDAPSLPDRPNDCSVQAYVVVKTCTSLSTGVLVVSVSPSFWGWMWGALGMILSVPLTMVLRILLEGSPATRPFAILMAGSEQAPGLEPGVPRSVRSESKKSR